MKRMIKVSMPKNLLPGEASLFEPFLTYDRPSLKVKIIKEPFITNSGLVYNQRGLVKESYHHMFANEYEDRLKEVVYYYNATKENSENLIILDDDEIYVLIHHTWHNNYYHWMSESILRLWLIKDKAKSIILLLPSEPQLSSFVKMTLEPFNFKKVVYIPKYKSLRVKKLLLPQIKPLIASYLPKALYEISNNYVSYVARTKSMNINLHDKLYVSRKNTGRRRIINEEEVDSMLQSLGFKTIYNEDYTFFEQVALYSNARYLVGNHGAGLTNILFMPKGSSILEFHKRKTTKGDYHSRIYWYMADGLGHNYYHQLCDPIDPEMIFYEADILVDIALLRRNVMLMLSNN